MLSPPTIAASCFVDAPPLRTSKRNYELFYPYVRGEAGPIHLCHVAFAIAECAGPQLLDHVSNREASLVGLPVSDIVHRRLRSCFHVAH
ncbi:hypothetical protein B296_00028656 [Ensete ventricosum]|uniref:Uncharacterized protein n=1 Tax=Ensete ventricosum TaxID=4639 RepID=A0A427AML4_ENSVE|nr:hypothetical protein B296_00028656 [Ensete ventricosum]